MKGGLEMKVQGLKTRKAAPAAECKEVGNQKGSLLLEAIVVLGMIATFTPMLYKHVADRRADIENINRANTLLYLQHKAEDYLKDPDNITALVEELGHNQHKEIYPSEMGAGDNFDGRYIVGIRREDENNKPVLKAMIIDTVHTGSDLRAAKVAELIGISAGIYTAVDPDAAWGINGIWSEPLSRYFDTTNIPTGAVAITTEYNKAKYRVNISDILVDADLDMGEFEVTAEQINAVAIAAQNGTLDQLIAQDVRASNKVVAGTKLCVGGEEDENCIESWEGLGGKDDSDLRLVQECNAGMTESCAQAFIKDLNTSCSKVDAIYDRFGAAYPSPKIYNLTYGSGAVYTGTVRTKCEGTQFVVDNISTATLTNPVEQVGGSAFAITQPGWYQITLMGEGSPWSGDYTNVGTSAGGILIANTYYDADTVITLKSIRGILDSGVPSFGGAGVALWDEVVTTGVPKLVAGGGGYCGGGGGYNGGYDGGRPSADPGYSWNESLGNNTTYCSSTTCNIGATGGRCRWGSASNSYYGWGGTGTGSSGYPCPSGYTCTAITGGNCTNWAENYSAATYGNWGTNTLTGGKGYASIRWCGPSGSASTCPDTCSTDSDCSGNFSYCDNGFCAEPETCSAAADCPTARPYCEDGICSATCTPPAVGTVVLNNVASGTYTVTCPGKYQLSARGGDGTRGYAGTNLCSVGAQGTGGYVYTNGYFNADDVFEVVTATGSGRDHGNDHWVQGGAGIGIKVNTNYIIVAGGGGAVNLDGNIGGGGGWIGGGNGCVAVTGGSSQSASLTCPGGGGTGLSGYASNGTAAYTLGNATGGAGGTASNSGNGSASAGTAGTPYGGTGAGVGYYWGSRSVMGYGWWAGGGGGSGYCAPGYTCAADAKGATAATGRVVYCGPNANSTCP